MPEYVDEVTFDARPLVGEQMKNSNNPYQIAVDAAGTLNTWAGCDIWKITNRDDAQYVVSIDVDTGYAGYTEYGAVVFDYNAQWPYLLAMHEFLHAAGYKHDKKLDRSVLWPTEKADVDLEHVSERVIDDLRYRCTQNR